MYKFADVCTVHTKVKSSNKPVHRLSFGIEGKSRNGPRLGSLCWEINRQLKADSKMKNWNCKDTDNFKHLSWENRNCIFFKFRLLSSGPAKGTATIFSPHSPLSLKAIILQLIFMVQGEIMGILSNVEMYVFLLVNQNRPCFKLVS